MFATWIALLTACASAPTPSDAPGASPPPPDATAASVQVAALSFPPAWLAEQVGGDRVQVRTVTPEGEDPPHWQPPAEVVAGLADAALIVANGAGFEAWTATATLPAAKLIDTARGLQLLEVQGTTHTHGKAGEHSHAGTDPHTWSDPLTFAAQAKAVHAGLARVDAAHVAAYDRNLDALQQQLTALHEELATALAPAKGRSLAANHPAYGYLARRYGLTITSFDVDPETPPSAEAAQAIAAWAAAAGEKPTMLWEDPPADAVVAALPGTIRHLHVDPLEQPVGGAYDYLAQARTNVGRFTDAFGAE